MTRRTGQFVFASLLVLCAGIGIGLAAYFGFPTSALSAVGGPEELRFLPRETAFVAFADVQQVMTSELRQKLRSSMPFTGDRQKSFQDETGINVETDIDRLVMGLIPAEGSAEPPVSTLVLARGRFDAVRVQAYLRDKGATASTYRDRPLFTPARSDGSALAFIEPGLVAVGSAALVRRAIDLSRGGDSVLANDALITRLRALDRGNVWAVGRFDALTGRADAMKGMMGQLPAITWFSATGQVDAGVRATLTAETRDDDAANSLRDLVRGFVALARLQASARPELQSLLQSVQLGGVGQSVTLTIELTPATLESLASSLQQLPRPAAPPR
jgi:hypothetical protein